MPELIEIAVSRAVAGFGIGLLLAGKFAGKNRRRIGWSLLLGSIAVGIPSGVRFLKKNKRIICK